MFSRSLSYIPGDPRQLVAERCNIFGRKSFDMLPRSSSESLKETGWENDIQTTVTTGPNPKIIELRGITISNEIRGSRKLYDDKVV